MKSTLWFLPVEIAVYSSAILYANYLILYIYDNYHYLTYIIIYMVEKTLLVFFIHTGPELVFVIYPQGLSTLPSPAVWSFLYFLMVFTLGLDSQVSYSIT